MNGQKICRLHNQLVGVRSVVWTTWDEAYRYCMPARYPQTTDGTTRTADVVNNQPVNGRGVRAAQDMASGLYTNTMRIGEPWFSLVARDRARMDNNDNVKRAYESATNLVLVELFSGNLAEQVHIVLREYVPTGTSVLYMYWDNGMKFRAYSCKDVVIAEDAAGNINTVIREMKLTNMQACEFFSEEGDALPMVVMKECDGDNAYQMDDYLHAVLPNKDYREDAGFTPDNGPFREYWVHKKTETVVRERVLAFLPYAIPRSFKEADCAYGVGQGVNATTTLRLLDRATKDFMEATEQAAFPTTWLPMGVSKKMVDLRPRAVNCVMGVSDQVPVFTTPNADLSSLYQLMTRLELDVDEYFFVTLFRALQNAPNGMTATEVLERNDEKLQLLLPIVSSLMSELYRPIILNTAIAMVLAGRMGDNTVALMQEKDKLTIEYSSRLASKLKDVETTRMLEVIQIVAQAAQLQGVPLVGSVFDIVKWVKRIAANKGIPPELIYSDEEIEEKLKAEAAAQSTAMANEQMGNAIAPLDLAKAPQPGSPLSRLMEAQ